MPANPPSPEAGPFHLADGLPILELCRIRRYVGAVERVIRAGAHRVLQMKARSADGRGLFVWVSSAALEDDRCKRLARKIDEAYPDAELLVCFHGRFGDVHNPTGLTTDIHYSDSIWVHEE